MRNSCAFATHLFFQERGFKYIHTPIITGADCEGAGEMFTVTTMLGENVKDIPATKDGKIDYSKDFFGKHAKMTVSGQLNVETYCCALSDVHLRPHLPRGELPLRAPPGGVLDDRARDGVAPNGASDA